MGVVGWAPHTEMRLELADEVIAEPRTQLVAERNVGGVQVDFFSLFLGLRFAHAEWYFAHDLDEAKHLIYHIEFLLRPTRIVRGNSAVFTEKICSSLNRKFALTGVKKVDKRGLLPYDARRDQGIG